MVIGERVGKKNMKKSYIAIGLLAASSCFAQIASISPSNGGSLTMLGSYVGKGVGTFGGLYNYVTGSLSINGVLSTKTTSPLGALTATITGNPLSGPPVNMSVNVVLTATTTSTIDVVDDNDDFLYTLTFTDTSYSFSKNSLFPKGNLYTLTLTDGVGTSVASGTFSAVPEPEAFAIAASLGLMGFGIWHRRQV
jgi:amino acid transporter